MRACVALLLLFVAASSGAATYGVRVVHVCPSTQNCDGDEKIFGKFNRVNQRFEQMGISFRPEIERVYDATWASIEDDADPGVDDLLEMAQDTPDRITFFVIQGSNEKCWAQLPQHVGAGSPQAYQLFCYSDVSGIAYAHELGHYFCLRHPFTFQDPATDSPVDHEGDGFPDTPPDPGVREGVLSSTGGHDQGPGREWCSTADIDHAFADVVIEQDLIHSPGVALARGCFVDGCTRSTDTGEIPIPFSPLAENGMSYYDCSGPWTVDGVRHEYFIAGQISRINQCIANEAERQLLVDVCEGIGDGDNDGLCDDEDPCPDRPTLQGLDVDADADGIVDGCDACTGFAGVGTDTDEDGYCDAIDQDDDGDTCKDNHDEHPLDDTVIVGYTIGDRPECTGAEHLWEGTPGPDGLKICRKTFTHDIDGDGIVDDSDACRLEPGLGCIRTVSCPLPPAHWRIICALGGCNEFELIATAVSNPGIVLARSRFEIMNGVMYARAAQGRTLLETAQTLSGAEPPGATQGGGAAPKSKAAPTEPRRLRFEIHKRGSGFVELMLEAPVTAIRLGKLTHGAVLALSTDRTNTRLDIGVSWGTGIAPGAPLPDADRDGIYDARDNCTSVANRDQFDADDDGFGNRCDPDLDNDGRATERDLVRLRGAIGGVAEVPFVAAEGDGVDVFAPLRVTVDYLAVADVDGDGKVTADDERRWRSARLGPSGYR
jgi:hypothetical protein